MKPLLDAVTTALLPHIPTLVDALVGVLVGFFTVRFHRRALRRNAIAFLARHPAPRSSYALEHVANELRRTKAGRIVPKAYRRRIVKKVQDKL